MPNASIIGESAKIAVTSSIEAETVATNRGVTASNALSAQIAASCRLVLRRGAALIAQSNVIPTAPPVNSGVLTMTSIAMVASAPANASSETLTLALESSDGARGVLGVVSVSGSGKPFTHSVASIVAGQTINVTVSWAWPAGFYPAPPPATPPPPPPPPSSYVPSAAPTNRGAMTWLLRSTDPAVVVPDYFMALHNDEPGGTAAPTYPYAIIRSHDSSAVGALSAHPTWWGRWHTVNAQGQDVFNWGALDAWIDFFFSRGKKIVFTLFGTPTAISESPGNVTIYGGNFPLGGTHSPTAANMYRFGVAVAALRQRYGSKIWAFEVFNEPLFGWADPWNDTDTLWSQVSGNQWFWMSNATKLAQLYRIARENAGSIPVLPPPFTDSLNAATNEPANGGQSRNSLMLFFSANDGAGGTPKNYAPSTSIHTYIYSATGDLTPTIDGLLRLRDIIRPKIGMSGKPWQNTEIGFEAGGSSATPAVKAISFRRLAIAHAALACQWLGFYRHSTGNTLGDPANNQVVRDALQWVGSTVPGKTLRQCVYYPDSKQVWAETQTNEVWDF